MISNHTDLRSNLLKTPEHGVQIVASQAGRHLRADAGLVPGHHGEHNGTRHDAFIAQSVRHGFGRGLSLIHI